MYNVLLYQHTALPMDEAIVQYLKEIYESGTPYDGPEAKQVRFSDIQDCLSQRFPNALLSCHRSSLLVKEAFLNSSMKHFGKGRQIFILDIKPATLSVPESVQKLLLNTCGKRIGY